MALKVWIAQKISAGNVHKPPRLELKIIETAKNEQIIEIETKTTFQTVNSPVDLFEIREIFFLTT